MSDSEPAIKKSKGRATENLPGVEAAPKESPEGDHQANGVAEAAVNTLKSIKTCDSANH